MGTTNNHDHVLYVFGSNQRTKLMAINNKSINHVIAQSTPPYWGTSRIGHINFLRPDIYLGEPQLKQTKTEKYLQCEHISRG